LKKEKDPYNNEEMARQAVVGTANLDCNTAYLRVKLPSL
jgi:hypothetical protein